MAEARNGAAAMLGMVEAMVTSALGPEAAPTATEKFLLETSLPQMLASMEPETVRKVQAVTYPFMFLAGLGAWGWRLYVLSRPGDGGGGSGPGAAPVVSSPPPSGAAAPIPEFSDKDRGAPTPGEGSPWGKVDARADLASGVNGYV